MASLGTELSPRAARFVRWSPQFLLCLPSLYHRLLTLPLKCGSGREGSAGGRGVTFVHNTGYNIRVALKSPQIAWLQKHVCVTCEVCSLVRVLVCLNVLCMICNYCCG